MAVIPFGIPLGFLFVPARERSLKDPRRFGDADALIFDLEDSLRKAAGGEDKQMTIDSLLENKEENSDEAEETTDGDN